MSPCYDRAKRWLKNVFRKPSKARALPPKRISTVTSPVRRPVATNQTPSPSQDQPASTHSAADASTEQLTEDQPAPNSSSGLPADGDRDSPQSPSPSQDQPPSTHSAAVASTEQLTEDQPAPNSSSGLPADGDRDSPQSRVKAAVDALPRVLAVASAALDVAEAFGAAFPPVQPVLKIAKGGLDGMKVIGSPDLFFPILC
jgi:hypothetical protein